MILFLLLLVFNVSQYLTFSRSVDNQKWDFDQQLEDYFIWASDRIYQQNQQQVAESYHQVKSRNELLEMLGLKELSFDKDVKAVVTGTTSFEDIIVENIQFQSLPGLYVTGNLYLPKDVDHALPTVLYLCGHARVKENNISYGNKVHYQHHGVWFAKNGYACFIIDTVQLGEIEGIHHGTYNKNRWWWIARGYTPAGVEAFNSIRALDYLATRVEVDTSRMGVTGRSGGGIYSYWIAALDKRIKVAAPTSGLTDLKNYVVDGCVDGHCDCMFMINTYQWDYTKLPMLFGPKPLLIGNADNDPLFPVDGVVRVYETTARAYQGEERSKLGINIVPGFHEDVPDIRIPAFRWFNQYLKGEDEPIVDIDLKPFSKEQLKVFDLLPDDEVNTSIDSFFVKQSDRFHDVLAQNSWEDAKESWKESLSDEVFRNWPKLDFIPTLKEVQRSKAGSQECVLYQVRTDAKTYLPVYWIKSKASKHKTVRVIIMDETSWASWKLALSNAFPDLSLFNGELDVALKDVSVLDQEDDLVIITVRGAGPTKYAKKELTLTQIKRRFYLMGQTLEQMQTWDILQAVNAINSLSKSKVEIEAQGQYANMLIYSSLFFNSPAKLALSSPKLTHYEGPTYLNVLKHMDVPASVLMVAEIHDVTIKLSDEESSDNNSWSALKKFTSSYKSIDFELQIE